MVSAVVAIVAPGTGDGKPLTYGSLSGDVADFALDSSTPPNIVVGPNSTVTSGAGCGMNGANQTDQVTVPVTQP
jgi:hypothetical protein